MHRKQSKEMFRSSEYLERKARNTEQHLPNPFESLGDPSLLDRLFAETRISIKHFLPNLTYETRSEVAKNLIHAHIDALFDLKELTRLRAASELDCVAGDRAVRIPGKSIVAAFHVNSFRILPAFVARWSESTDLAILVSTAAMSAGKALYLNLFEKLQSLFDVTPHLIDVEKAGGLQRAIASAKRGAILFLYFDGFSGSGGMTRKDEKLLEVPFLQGKIKARQGVPFLSYILDAPIYVASSQKDETGYPTVHLTEAFSPSGLESREVYNSNVLFGLYSKLEQLVQTYIDSWEGWWYVYKTALPLRQKASTLQTNRSYSPGQLVKLNTESFDIFPIGEERLLANIETLRFKPLTISSFHSPILSEGVTQWSDDALLNQLRDAGALTTVENDE